MIIISKGHLFLCAQLMKCLQNNDSLETNPCWEGSERDFLRVQPLQPPPLKSLTSPAHGMWTLRPEVGYTPSFLKEKKRWSVQDHLGDALKGGMAAQQTLPALPATPLSLLTSRDGDVGDPEVFHAGARGGPADRGSVFRDVGERNSLGRANDCQGRTQDTPHRKKRWIICLSVLSTGKLICFITLNQELVLSVFCSEQH